jgi:hypothetical protein
LYAWTVSTEPLVTLLRPKVALAAFALLTRESVLSEERYRKLFLVNFHFNIPFYITWLFSFIGRMAVAGPETVGCNVALGSPF